MMKTVIDQIVREKVVEAVKNILAAIFLAAIFTGLLLLAIEQMPDPTF